ncbi:MAG: hypothetical protein M3O34_03350 [Chloroflexota bacterium]|nr:hypothetical protein [Chloroflexota bacterium]
MGGLSHARRKQDGRAFWIVRGRTNTYYTAAEACTCPGFTRRGICSHSLAATMREAREASRRAPCELPIEATVAIRPTRDRYSILFPETDD